MYKLLPPAEGSSYSVATVLASSSYRGSARQNKKGKGHTLHILTSML